MGNMKASNSTWLVLSSNVWKYKYGAQSFPSSMLARWTDFVCVAAHSLGLCVMYCLTAADTSSLTKKTCPPERMLCVYIRKREEKKNVSISNSVTTSRSLFLVEKKEYCAGNGTSKNNAHQQLGDSQPLACWQSNPLHFGILIKLWFPTWLTDDEWQHPWFPDIIASQQAKKKGGRRCHRAGSGHLLWMIFALDYHEQIAPSLLFNDRPFSFLLKLLTDE